MKDFIQFFWYKELTFWKIFWNSTFRNVSLLKIELKAFSETPPHFKWDSDRFFFEQDFWQNTCILLNWLKQRPVLWDLTARLFCFFYFIFLFLISCLHLFFLV